MAAFSFAKNLRVHHATWVALAFAIAVGLLAPAAVRAATVTWSGAGTDNNWATAANWVGGVAPISGDDLVFPGSAARLTNVNNLLASTGFSSISFQASGYSISGNAIGISTAAGITVAAGVTGTNTVALAIALTVDQTWTVSDAGATLDVSGVTSGTAALTKAGAGTYRVSGTATNSYTGGLIVNAGTVLLNKTSGKNIVTGTLTITGGLVQSLASNEIPGKRVTVAYPGLLDLNNFSDTIGGLTLTGGAVTTGTGTLTLGGTVTGNASATTATITGNLGLGGNRTFSINDGTATDDVSITAVISGAFNVTKSGAGTLAFTVNNTYTGTTTINAGQLVVTANNGLGTIAGKTTIASGATLGFRGGFSYSTPETLSVTGTGVGAAGAVKNVSEDNSFAGPITLTAASTIGSATAANTLTLTGTLTNGGFATTFSGAGNTVVNGIILGTGAVTKSGTGVLTLAAANLYTGVTTVSAGTLRVTSTLGSPTGTGAVTVSSGAFLDGANPGGIAGTTTIANGGNLTPGNARPGTLNTGALVLNSTSNLNFELGTTSDQVSATGNLTADGVLNVTAAGGFGAGTYTLFSYTGVLTNNVINIGSVPAGPAYFIDVATAGQVMLRVHPVVASIVRNGTDPTNATSVSFTVTFSEAVTGVDATDFSLTTTGAIAGASVSGVSGSGSVYTVTANTGSGSGTIRLDLIDNNSIVTGGNPLGGNSAGDGNFTSGQVYTVDKTAPSVVSSNRAGPDPTSTATVDFTVTFSEAVTGVDLTDLGLTTTGLSGTSVSAVSGSGAVYTVTVNTGTGSGTIRLDVLDDDTIVDAAGNPLGGTGAGNGGFTTGQTYTIDRNSPSVAMSTALTNPTRVSPIPVTVTFTKTVTGFTASDVTLSNGTLGNFTGSGLSYAFDLTPTANGLVTADIPAGVAFDVDGRGNVAAPQFAMTYDSVAPTVASINLASTSPTNASSISFTATFSEVVTGVDATDFALTTTGVSGASISGVTGSGASRTVTVNTGSGSGTIRLDLGDDDSIVDAAGNPLGGTGAGNGNGSYTSGQTCTIDKLAPTVAMSSTTGDPTNVSPIPVTVTFSESVTGFTASDLTTVNGSVSNFTGSGAAYSFDLTPGASGAVTADIAASAAADAAGNGNSAALQFRRTYDAIASTVTSVYSTVADGTFGLGFTIPILVAFDEAVTVTGTPQLTLNTASTPNGIASYVSGSGSSTLTFDYTVAAGQSSAHLDYLSTSALALNGGTIKDAAGNNADLTLAAPGAPGSLADNNNIVIDSNVPGVTNVTSTTADGSYGAGSVIVVNVVFSGAETVTGTPQLTLNTSSSPNAVASYSSGSGTTTLTFSFTVAAGQNSPDLDYLSASALALNGGTIKKLGSGTNANLTLPDPGTPGSLAANKAIIVDTTVPTITDVTSTTANGTYGAGAAVNVTVDFAEPVTLAGGNLNVTLDTGASVAISPFGPASSASGTYTVGAGQSSSRLNANSPLTLASGATLRDLAGNNATLTIPAGHDIADLKAIVIQTVSSVSVGNAAFAFGTRPLNAWLAPQSTVLTNDGNATETLVGKISTLTAGTNTWSLSSTSNGPDQIRAQWSTTSATGPWTDISAYDTNFTIVTGLAASANVNLYVRILTPVSTLSLTQYASSLTVTAQ
ncbi:MAG: autotransporter-associated beta strand repeat-containing protein [Candidatus Eisenbacteria bacterium]|nr:autotransporter-associated beta strand repeat-containing protein [Candidatus Eisenbacteria bacterium]